MKPALLAPLLLVVGCHHGSPMPAAKPQPKAGVTKSIVGTWTLSLPNSTDASASHTGVCTFNADGTYTEAVQNNAGGVTMNMTMTGVYDQLSDNKMNLIMGSVKYQTGNAQWQSMANDIEKELQKEIDKHQPDAQVITWTNADEFDLASTAVKDPSKTQHFTRQK